MRVSDNPPVVPLWERGTLSAGDYGKMMKILLSSVNINYPFFKGG